MQLPCLGHFVLGQGHSILIRINSLFLNLNLRQQSASLSHIIFIFFSEFLNHHLFFIFDSYKRPSRWEGALFVCFRKEDNSWGKAISFGDNVNTGANMCAKLSPDGKYIFYFANKDIYWVDAKVIVDLKSKELK